jgi:uncharacterized protein GlcG (DUF336 family)
MSSHFSSLRLQAFAATVACVLAISCGSANNPNSIPVVPPNSADNVLTRDEVNSIVMAAANSVNVLLVIAVSDRRGNILAVYSKKNAPMMTIGDFNTPVRSDDEATALARTAAFFSNDQAPIGSRTVRFLSGIHFPPGIKDTESAPLYGIENTNRGCGFNVTPEPLPPATLYSDPTKPGLGIQTGKFDTMDSKPASVNPGGIPIFKNNRVAGGIGVVASTGDIAEYAAFAATFGNHFGRDLTQIPPGEVVLGGVALPFVIQSTIPAGLSPETSPFDSSLYAFGPISSPGAVPEGDLIPEAGSSFPNGLTLAQVNQIVQNAVATGNKTRAAIRLPPGTRAKFVIAVADLDGHLLALYRMPDATVFSVDVAVAKSRNVVYFSGTPNPIDLPGVPQGTAVTNRTLDFGGQPLFPEGIDGTQPGPFFPLFLKDRANPCTQGSATQNPKNQNGIVFFPGSVPLYLNGKLVGGLGVSGDGVDQDDFAAAGGAVGFEAPLNIRADNIFIRGVRLPYQKFPRNPTQ